MAVFGSVHRQLLAAVTLGNKGTTPLPILPGRTRSRFRRSDDRLTTPKPRRRVSLRLPSARRSRSTAAHRRRMQRRRAEKKQRGRAAGRGTRARGAYCPLGSGAWRRLLPLDPPVGPEQPAVHPHVSQVTAAGLGIGAQNLVEFVRVFVAADTIDDAVDEPIEVLPAVGRVRS